MRTMMRTVGVLGVLVVAYACSGTGTFTVSGTLNVQLAAFQVNDPCGDIPVTQSSHCSVASGQECSTACDKVSYEAACTEHNFQVCGQKCVAEPKQECTTSCDTQCGQECRTQPAQVVCANTCQTRCSASCGAECSANANSAGCSWRCRTTCGNSCEQQCQTIPATATCEEKCHTACGVSCRTVEEMHCHEECQTQSYQTCAPKLVEECHTKCTQTQGVMVCDDQFVDAQDPNQCQQYLQNAFHVNVGIGLGGVVL